LENTAVSDAWDGLLGLKSDRPDCPALRNRSLDADSLFALDGDVALKGNVELIESAELIEDCRAIDVGE
jgi:hypothetical protein